MNKELRIANILKDLGVAANLRGYHYLKNAIELVTNDMSYVQGICKRLYPEIAKRFSTTASRVERNIRHAIETGWLKGDEETEAMLFGYTVSASRGRPTNGEFIGTVADYLRMTQED